MASTATASSAPAAATAKETSGAPATQASLPRADSAWEKASRPHGNPPKGTADRATSPATNRVENESTCSRTLRPMRGTRRTHVHTSMTTPTKSASRTLSAIQGTSPTAYCAHWMCLRKKVTPHTTPSRAFHQGASRFPARNSIATPTGASTQMPVSGKARSVTRPPAAARRRASRRGTGRAGTRAGYVTEVGTG